MIKAVFRAIPYVIVVLFAVMQSRFQQLSSAVIATGARQPNESSGEVWEIAYRGGAYRYLTLQDYLTYYAPFVMVPAFIGAVIWILIDLYNAGFIGQGKR